MRTSNADQITNGRWAEAREMPVVVNDRQTWISLGPPYEPPRSDRINLGAARSEPPVAPAERYGSALEGPWDSTTAWRAARTA
jgi:hypothetical protein